MCFLCLWDSRAKNQYKIKKWPERVEFQPGIKNVINTPLVEKENIILPPLHIKLGLFKNLLKALQKNESDGFDYVKKKFGNILTESKIKEGMLTGPQIRKLILDTDFDRTLSKKELRAWTAFKEVDSKFLGNEKSPNYENLIEELLKSFENINVNMSLKIHFLNSHLDFFPENLGAVSDQHGERFHQTFARIESFYKNKSKYSSSMLADYIWLSMGEDDPVIHNRNKV